MDTMIGERLEMSDARLAEMALLGESAAFDTLVRRFQRAVYAVAFAALSDREAALDVLQESFISAYRQLHQLDDPAKFGPWVCGIARNQAKQHIRSRSRIASRELPMPEEEAAVIEQRPDRLAEEIGGALACLTETQADVIALFYMEGYSIAESAALLGVPQGRSSAASTTRDNGSRRR